MYTRRTDHRLYGAWSSMKQYHRDDMCKRWNKFEHFVEDMDQEYIENRWFTRKDKTKKYTKDNCLWDEQKNIRNGIGERHTKKCIVEKQKQNIDSLVAETLRQRTTAKGV